MVGQRGHTRAVRTGAPPARPPRTVRAASRCRRLDCERQVKNRSQEGSVRQVTPASTRGDRFAAGPAAAGRQGREPVPAAGLSSVHIKQQESVALERLPRGVDTVKAGASPVRPPRAVVAASLRRRLGC